MQSQVFGNLIAALILGKMDQISYFTVMSVIAFAASISFAFLRKPVKQVSKKDFRLELSQTDSDIQDFTHSDL